MGFAVLLTLLPSGVGVYYFERSGGLSFRLRSQSMPALHAAWSADLEGQRLRTLGLSLLSDLPLNETVSGQESVAQILRHLEAQLAVAGALPVLAPTAQQAQTEAYEIARTVDDIVLHRQALGDANTRADDLLAGLPASPISSNRPSLDLLYSVLSAPDQPALDRLWTELEVLSSTGAPPALAELAGGYQGAFALRQQQLAVQSRIQELGVELRRSSPAFEATLSQLTDAASRESALALESTVGSFDQGRVLLAVISLASVIAATLAAWLWVGNGMVRRLSRLSERMRRMADGDLEMPVPEVGQDEIGELAHALEVFRQQVLEVQRLNLVEQLYGELREANEEMKRMQDRLVAQEKLAALGELVSGVAHEISNPLNFVKNFSEGGQNQDISRIKDGHSRTKHRRPHPQNVRFCPRFSDFPGQAAIQPVRPEAIEGLHYIIFLITGCGFRL